MQRSLIETVMGAVVLIVATLFLVFVYRHTGITSVDGYELVAQFEDVGTLSVGSDVRVGGIKVGSVSSQGLDPENFLAKVRLTIRNDLRLPLDTSARIQTDGLLGGQFLALTPGGDDEEFLEPGDIIEYTYAPVDLVQLMGKFMFATKQDGSAQ